MKKGLVHIYWGDGKGKTTCAVGVAVRALGNGLIVRLYQFLKDAPSGELEALKRFAGAKVCRAEASGGKFLWEMDSREEAACLESQRQLFEKALADAQSPEIDLLILDEILSAGEAIGKEAVIDLIARRNPGTEIVLTGHQADGELLSLADYATFFHKQKHPFDRGERARRGIEY